MRSRQALAIIALALVGAFGTVGFVGLAPARAHNPLGESIEDISGEIRKSPTEATLYLRRGELFPLAGDWDRAAADFDRAARLDPRLAEVDLSRADLHLDRGEPAGALEAVDRCIERGADGAEARIVRARALRALGRDFEASDELRLAIDASEAPSPELYLERAQLLSRRGSAKDREEALATLDEGIARLGELVTLEDLAIDHELLAGRPDAALARHDRLESQFQRKDAWLERRDEILRAARWESDRPASPRPIGAVLDEPVFRHAAFSTSEPEASAQAVLKESTAAGSAAALATVTRGPYLQIGTPASVVVRWRTDTATTSRVQFGPSPYNLDFAVQDLTSTTEHVVTLTGLLPETMYYYSVGTTTAVLAGGDNDTYFLTPPLPGDGRPTRIWVIGDAGTADSNQRAVRDAYYNYTGTTHTNLWLMLGDNAYSSGTDSEYQSAVFNIYGKMLKKSVLWPTRGNHDEIHSSSNNDYYDIFSMPKTGQAGGVASGTEAYYSFDHGNIHFICLDSEGSSRSATGAMATWLQADLAASPQQWVIAYWHHPPYSKGSHDSDESSGELKDMRQNIVPILDTYGADLVLSGHSHSYERSFCIKGPGPR